MPLSNPRRLNDLFVLILDKLVDDALQNNKSQAPNYKKSQIPILNDLNRLGILNFGHCDLFGICNLLFVNFGYSSP
jgi:hypothetical protein